jgi:hypothetical protein
MKFPAIRAKRNERKLPNDDDGRELSVVSRRPSSFLLGPAIVEGPSNSWCTYLKLAAKTFHRSYMANRLPIMVVGPSLPDESQTALTAGVKQDRSWTKTHFEVCTDSIYPGLYSRFVSLLSAILGQLDSRLISNLNPIPSAESCQRWPQLCH